MEEATVAAVLLIFGINHCTDKRLLNEHLIRLATILERFEQVTSMHLVNEGFKVIENINDLVHCKLVILSKIFMIKFLLSIFRQCII